MTFSIKKKRDWASDKVNAFWCIYFIDNCLQLSHCCSSSVPHQLHPIITSPFSSVQIIFSGGGKAKLQASNSNYVADAQSSFWTDRRLLHIVSQQSLEMHYQQHQSACGWLDKQEAFIIQQVDIFLWEAKLQPSNHPFSDVFHRSIKQTQG